MGSLEVCELCAPKSILIDNELAYVQIEKSSLSDGHVIVVPRRHIADFFEMSQPEQVAVLELLNTAHDRLNAQFSPDGYNIGVNVGRAAGQSRMHVHVHLIPRYEGDVADPSGGIRCVLSANRAP